MSGARPKSTPPMSNMQDWGARGTAGVSFAAGLSFRDVVVRLGGNLVLDKLSFSIEPGEIVCLLGESGSGKSTILRVAAGIQPIESGEVRINQQIVSAPGLQIAPEKRGVGLMFQDFALFPHMTLLQNVAFGLEKLGKKEAHRQARTALKRVGLADREADYPHMLSGGQQQRLALARTIAPRPGIIMLDEPFSGLDARMRETVRGETLAVLRETGATGLIVTHDPAEAMLLGDRIALLRDGKLVQIDQSNAVYAAPVDLAAARFLTHLSEIKTVVHDGEVDTPFGKVPAPGRAEGQRAVVAIRTVGDVYLTKQGQGTPGRIVSKREALGIDIIEVQIDGLNLPVRVRQPADDSVKVGNDVFLHLDKEHVLVFDQD
jgi:iron(III) transport system ATP-binding protein